MDRDAIARLMEFSQTCRKVYLIVGVISVAITLLSAFPIRKRFNHRGGNGLILFASLWLAAPLLLLICSIQETASAFLFYVVHLVSYLFLAYAAIAFRKQSSTFTGHLLLTFSLLLMFSFIIPALSSLTGLHKQLYNLTRGAIVYYEVAASSILGALSALGVAATCLAFTKRTAPNSEIA